MCIRDSFEGRTGSTLPMPCYEDGDDDDKDFYNHDFGYNFRLKPRVTFRGLKLNVHSHIIYSAKIVRQDKVRQA